MNEELKNLLSENNAEVYETTDSRNLGRFGTDTIGDYVGDERSDLPEQPRLTVDEVCAGLSWDSVYIHAGTGAIATGEEWERTINELPEEDGIFDPQQEFPLEEVEAEWLEEEYPETVCVPGGDAVRICAENPSREETDAVRSFDLFAVPTTGDVKEAYRKMVERVERDYPWILVISTEEEFTAVWNRNR